MNTQKVYGPWIEWHGGERPVPLDTRVEVKLRSGKLIQDIYNDEERKKAAKEVLFDIEAIEIAFFNHDGEGGEPAQGSWEKRCDQWRSFKTYLAAHPRHDAYKERALTSSPAFRPGFLGSFDDN